MVSAAFPFPASLALPFGSPSRNLYIDRIVFFSPFFRFRIKKSCRNIWTIERETKDSKRCSLKSFFKDNEKTKDLFPRIIRKISEKKKILNAKNFNGNLGVSSSFVSIFHRKVDERRA